MCRLCEATGNEGDVLGARAFRASFYFSRFYFSVTSYFSFAMMSSTSLSNIPKSFLIEFWHRRWVRAW